MYVCTLMQILYSTKRIYTSWLLMGLSFASVDFFPFSYFYSEHSRYVILAPTRRAAGMKHYP